jgi:16S rRNA (uracil1498-N3)-methyltransferase
MIALSDDETHHLVAVNRARIGDTVVAFDGDGREWTCRLEAAGKREARLSVIESRIYTRLPWSIALGQSLPKGKCMDSIVRKATEIGAAEILPLVGDRTEVQLEAEREETKLAKWRAAAIEAAKQCGNPFIPRILPVQRASALMRSTSEYDMRLLASLQPDARSLRTALAGYEAVHGQPPRRVLWLVGPEGDFSPAEVELSRENGFEPITLGPLVLRCETAAVCALAILSYELSNRLLPSAPAG